MVPSDDDVTDLMDIFRPGPNEVLYEGLVKVKLVHGRFGSVLLPDLLAIDLDGWRWFEPQFFLPPMLGFLDKRATAQFSFEPSADVRLTVFTTRDRLVRSYDDGSFLYRCRLAGPADIRAVTAGTCSVDSDSVIWLDLFHHTKEEFAEAIRRSGHFRASAWNIQGNKKLANVHYVYFTNMPRIRNDLDLKRIAMASDGKLELGTTNRDVKVCLDVYRESTLNRTHALAVRVPAHLVASKHVWRHDPVDGFVYYESSHPAIFRVGLEPATVLPFMGDAVTAAGATLKRFEYVVLGDATTTAGLVAPYDEEHTKELFKVERCETEGDLFEFWKTHPNQDHYTGRATALQTFES